MSVLTRRLKSLAERTLGVTITRTPSASANKHSDRALARLRKWSGRDVVFDVGANDGRTVLRLQGPLSSPRIYAFEPVAATYRKLVDRTRHLGNVHCFQHALGEEPGRREIYVDDIDAMSSFLPDWGAAVATETVEVKTVDQVMAELDVDFVHYLKIDTEGFELEVLKGTEEALSSSRIAIVQAEVGFGQTRHSFATLEQMRQHLAPMGYVLHGIYNQCHSRAELPADWTAGQLSEDAAEVLVYCDALFIRADV